MPTELGPVSPVDPNSDLRSPSPDDLGWDENPHSPTTERVLKVRRVGQTGGKSDGESGEGPVCVRGIGSGSLLGGRRSKEEKPGEGRIWGRDTERQRL